MPQEPTEREERIRERAYMLWQGAGSPVGEAEAFWHKAIEELEAEWRSESMVDKEIADSFPASDPPSHTGITGAGGTKR
ncbi:DUF2934 domain-containing protein [Acetobacteraceae bacterium H6797]|nr:DUF2934 domain-containing protein [Acetobacteraceae bacterium H6797]